MDTIPVLDQFEAVGGLPLMRCANERAVDNATQEGNQRIHGRKRVNVCCPSSIRPLALMKSKEVWANGNPSAAQNPPYPNDLPWLTQMAIDGVSIWVRNARNPRHLCCRTSASLMPSRSAISSVLWPFR